MLPGEIEAGDDGDPSLGAVNAEAVGPQDRDPSAGDPPDLVVAPRLAHFGLLDFHRSGEAIEEGRRAVERVAGPVAAGERGGR
jgi:predicted acylesterase/phospholipase RssA